MKRIIPLCLTIIVLILLIGYIKHAYKFASIPYIRSFQEEMTFCDTWDKNHSDEGIPQNIASVMLDSQDNYSETVKGGLTAFAVKIENLKHHSLRIDLGKGFTGGTMITSDWFNIGKKCVLPRGTENSAYIPGNRSMFSNVGRTIFPISNNSDNMKSCVIITEIPSSNELSSGCDIVSKNDSNPLQPLSLWENNMINLYVGGGLTLGGYQNYPGGVSYTVTYSKK